MSSGGTGFAARRAMIARRRLTNAMDVMWFGGALIVIVLGALMVTESVVNIVTGTTLFFDGIGRPFEFVVGFIAIVFGATLIHSLK